MAVIHKLKNKDTLAFFLFASFWILFVCYSGTIKSGYHFTDDHGIIRMHKQIVEKGFVNATQSILTDDFKIRFRPFYYMHFSFQTWLLKLHFGWWSIYNLTLAIFSSYFLFLFFYRQGYRFLHAFLFALLALVGGQSAIWWKLATNESIGFFLLSASLFFLSNSVFKEKKYQLYISAFFMFLSSISKESFVMFIPAYMLLLVLLPYLANPTPDIWTIIRENRIILTFFSLLLFIELYLIVFVVGTNKIGYAGVDSNSLNISGLLTFIFNHLKKSHYALIICLSCITLIAAKWKEKNKVFDKVNKVIWILSTLIFFAIILPQFLLYAKSGIYERYLLPINLGFSFFSIFLLDQIFKRAEVKPILKNIHLFICIIALAYIYKFDVLKSARRFTGQGVATAHFLSTISTNASPSDSILVILNPSENYEWGYSINSYLQEIALRKNIYFFLTSTPTKDDFANELGVIFKRDFSKQIVDSVNSNFSAIAMFPFSTGPYVKNELDKNALYKRINCDNYDYFTVYVKSASMGQKK